MEYQIIVSMTVERVVVVLWLCNLSAITKSIFELYWLHLDSTIFTGKCVILLWVLMPFLWTMHVKNLNKLRKSLGM